MKRYVLVIVGIFLAVFGASAQQDSLLVLFWNVENFYDYKVNADRGWSARRFYAKVGAVTKTLLWSADQLGQLPDAVGFAELEDAYVLKQLCYSDELRKYGYSYIHFDSPDPRGIDVGLLYRKSRLKPVSARPVRIAEFRTRDILVADFETTSGDTLHLIVNHHPSKYGGAGTDDRRKVAMRVLKGICDSLSTSGTCRRTVAVGDFNDTPDGGAFPIIKGVLDNLAEVPFNRGEGTIRYDGKWELIDMIMVSDDLSDTEMKILYPPFLMTRDTAHSGEKPLRTYSGPRYLGGVSDHLPVAAKLYIK